MAAPEGDLSSTKLPANVTTYEVAAGDTLLGIAHHFSITPETILWANGLGGDDLLRIGQKLTILPVSGVLHRVKPGDSILSIAATYSADPARIVEANGLSDSNMVREDDVLLVPGGVMKSGGAFAPFADAAPPTTKYTVKQGDTLYSIAAALGVRAATIVSSNNLANSDMLKIGQILSIPGGNPPAPAGAQTTQLVAMAPEAPVEVPQERDTSNRGEQHDGKSFVANVTAYAMNGRTATGTSTRWGVIAVDPRMIPLGSKVRIDGFEELFTAEDTGGAIKDNWIDLWFPSHAEAIRFGIQARRVTVVEP